MKNKEKAVIICDAISGVLVTLSILVYLVLGFTISWWHPGWIIIVVACFVSSVASIIANMVVELKKADAEKSTENEKSAEDKTQE